MKKSKILILAAMAAMLFSCEHNETTDDFSVREINPQLPIYIDLGNTSRSIVGKSSGIKGNAKGITEVALYSAEYITTGDSEEMGNIVFFNARGNKKLSFDFVPYDWWSIDGTADISYYIDENRPSEDLDVEISSRSIDSAMNTWDNITCSNLNMFKLPSDGRVTGFMAAVVSGNSGHDYGGTFDWAPADIMHNGWMPEAFFDDVFGPGNSVLAVTFTIGAFVDGEFTDMDKNGKLDVAWREIYYNDKLKYVDDNSYPNYNVETVALHESGHGLSQGHFGKAFASGNFDIGNAKLHFSPRAAMNPAYSGTQTMIEATDEGGHCANWSSWPKQ